jgi:hypothetical protein
MGRKNRRKPFQCPVFGCHKRGLRADLVRHASVMHPEVTREAYMTALARETLIGAPSLAPARWVRWLVIGMTASAGLSVTLTLLMVALSWVVNSRLIN